jgi:DNA-binding transcriptional LysR family regulator
MDTELLRTFLEINRTRHFGRAAANLYLTQSAVSARIRLLEQTLGVTLFTRDRNDIQLTPQGRKLVDAAETILTAWNRARQEIAVAEEGKSALTVGGVSDFWDTVLEECVHALVTRIPDLVLNAEVLDTETLTRRLTEGALDLAFMFESPQSEGFIAEEFVTARFVMVATEPGLDAAAAIARAYVLVNWGIWFTSAHAKYFPELPTPVIRFGAGRLAHGFILRNGGRAYLPEPMVTADLEQGRLYRVSNAPTMSRRGFAIYRSDSDNRRLIEEAISILRSTARLQQESAELA